MTPDQLSLIPHKEYLTLEEAAIWIGRTTDAIYKLIQGNVIRHYNPGGFKSRSIKYVKRADLEKYIADGEILSKAQIAESAKNQKHAA